VKGEVEAQTDTGVVPTRRRCRKSLLGARRWELAFETVGFTREPARRAEYGPIAVAEVNLRG
jgi:hypothetical protein